MVLRNENLGMWCVQCYVLALLLHPPRGQTDPGETKKHRVLPHLPHSVFLSLFIHSETLIFGNINTVTHLIYAYVNKKVSNL